METDGWVYFIHEKDNFALFKIGMTKRTPEERIAELQTGNPSELLIFAVIRTTDALKCEKMLHRLFSRYRKRGEWFSISVKDIRQACRHNIGYEEREIFFTPARRFFGMLFRGCGCL